MSILNCQKKSHIFKSEPKLLIFLLDKKLNILVVMAATANIITTYNVEINGSRNLTFLYTCISSFVEAKQNPVYINSIMTVGKNYLNVTGVASRKNSVTRDMIGMTC